MNCDQKTGESARELKPGELARVIAGYSAIVHFNPRIAFRKANG
jgi:hypothetical protein